MPKWERLKQLISELKLIIADKTVLKREIEKELLEVKQEYADKRRTKIEGAIDLLTEADLIPDEEVVVTLTDQWLHQTRTAYYLWCSTSRRKRQNGHGIIGTIRRYYS